MKILYFWLFLIQSVCAIETRIYSLTSIVHFCGFTNYDNPVSIREKWGLLSSYYNSCSFGKTRFDLIDNFIIPDIIEMPCFGTLPIEGNTNYQPLSFNMTTPYFGYGGLNAIKYFSQQYAKNHGINLASFNRFIYISPILDGPGITNAYGSYNQSIKYDVFVASGTDLVTYFHEIGHTMGMSHSHTLTSGYGDGSCAMGGCCGTRCFNAPQSYSIGWNSPIEDISSGSLIPTHRWSYYVIPGFLSTPVNFYMFADYYLSFKIPIGYDVNLQTQYINKVFVHKYNAQQDRGSLLLFVLDTIDNIAYLPDVDLHVHVVSIQPGVSATIGLCVGTPPLISTPISPPILTPPTNKIFVLATQWLSYSNAVIYCRGLGGTLSYFRNSEEVDAYRRLCSNEACWSEGVGPTTWGCPVIPPLANIPMEIECGGLYKSICQI